jgi:hypothetical protein
MSSGLIVFLELLLVLGLVLGLAIWDLRSLGNEKRRDETADRGAVDPAKK